MKAVENIDQNYLIKQLPTPTAFVGKNGVVMDASDSWLEIFGLVPTKKKRKLKILDFFPEAKDFQNNNAFSLKHKNIINDNISHFESSFTPWFDDNENVLGSIIQTKDITSEVEKELEIERLKNILKYKSEAAKIGWWEYDVLNEEIFWCDETKRIHKAPDSYRPDINEAINFYKSGFSQNRISMLFHNAMTKGDSYEVDLIILTFKGEERWVRATGKPILKNGKVVKLFGTLKDIHEQVMAETKIKENQQLLTTLIDSLPLNVYVKDLESKKVLVNKAECDYLGKSAAEILGKSDFDLYDEKMAQISREEDLLVMKHLKPILGKETESAKKDGKTTYFLTSKIPRFDLDGRVNGLIGISMDISAIKKKEEQLQNLISITTIQNKKLVNFAHIVSHNLRSHSANFSMLLEFLNYEENQEERGKILKMLNHASDNLLETLENLNQVVDVNTKTPQLKKQLNLHDSIVKAQQNIVAFSEKNKARIINNIPKQITVSSVPAYLDSIILNLITNAIKYKKPDLDPVITIDAFLENNQVCLRVSDNGLGIDLEKNGDKVFGMYKTFHQREDAKGFGLYLVRNQIEAMGGTITIESEVDKGSSFNVYFNEENE
ncbi:PAS domain-containing sensor histidine kinase [Flagellimonas zhangzhouensis]|uniref:histidine kinase n=1 Tax=Flagellimonas zhangzhouensis TaxID=1073328 RepID=A0A1H2YZM5_9FLAO|nr:PAS domain-containing sensor histidine kinase [Allomuricauda zhangzhouensis]SDR04763.1 PAS domain S-box-containing protein [Allomuricauda zhangzhouensis]SDX10198.1 PAS domain S-box-containing protein [Allomuricauda zhangzhouensis]